MQSSTLRNEVASTKQAEPTRNDKLSELTARAKIHGLFSFFKINWVVPTTKFCVAQDDGQTLKNLETIHTSEKLYFEIIFDQ